MTCSKMTHSSHKHELTRLSNRISYGCNGCKEPGWGDRYSCEKCDYHLHEDCAMHSNSLYHPFFQNGTVSFYFLEHAPGLHDIDRYCKACGKKVQGYAYHCYETGDDLHPVCANLPLVAQQNGVEARLKKKISKKCRECGHCRTVRSSHTSSKIAVKCWSYKINATNEEYHLACLTEIMVKNLEKGYSIEPARNNKGKEMGNLFLELVRGKAGTSRQSSNLEKTKTIANIVLTFIFGGHVAGIATIAASAASALLNSK